MLLDDLCGLLGGKVGVVNAQIPGRIDLTGQAFHPVVFIIPDQTGIGCGKGGQWSIYPLHVAAAGVAVCHGGTVAEYPELF